MPLVLHARWSHSLFSSGISGSETKMNVATSDRPRIAVTIALSATVREHLTGCSEPMLSRVASARGRMLSSRRECDRCGRLQISAEL